MTSHHPAKFAILGAKVVTPNWNGTPTTLAWHDSVSMPQTPNGSTVLAWLNKASLNNDGTLALTSGATQPQFLDAPQGSTIPSILVQNFGANNLNITNLSAAKDTPIWLEMFGPGIPGAPAPTPLSAGAAPVKLAPGSTGSGKSPPNYAQLVLQSNTSNLTIVSLIGGPNSAGGTNGYVFALNYPGAAPDGYTKVTATNTITYQFYWTTSFFIANMSPSNSAPVEVSLISL